MKKENMERELAQGDILPLLLRLSVPGTIAQIVNALYSMVDRMFIGRMEGVGTIALTGLGMTLPVVLLISAFSYLIGRGGGPLQSISLGQKDKETARKLQGNSLLLLLITGAVLTAVFYFFSEPILRAFGTSDAALPYASSYLRIYVLGTIPVMISLGMNPFLNAQGFTMLGTVTVVLGAVLNIVLDPIFIYVLGMGIAGAALATVISQTVSAVWVIYLIWFSDRLIIKTSLADMKPAKGLAKKICGLGASSFIFTFNDSVVQILLNLLLRYWSPDTATGDMYIGCMTIVYSMYQIFFMPLTGVAQGAQPIVGYCRGSGDYARMKKTINYARACSLLCAFIMWALYMAFPSQIAGLFTTDEELLSVCSGAIRIAFCLNFVLGMQMINQHMFIAMGNAKLSFIFGIMRKIIVLIPLALIFPFFMGAVGVFFAEPVSNLITVIVTYICFTRYVDSLTRGSQKCAA